jgi:hypothetical protein
VNGLAPHRLSCAALALYLAANFAAVNAAQLQSDKFVGAIGCKSSSCHGGAGEKRSQYLTWAQQDFHAKAYAILTNARSARIAETLSLPSAPTSARCTICHSPLQSVAPARLTSTANIDEGVSCESCHNAAGLWLRGHTRKDWTYAMRVSAGMRDLRSFYVRANTCVACHQNLEPDVIKAGHPELTFELDGQSEGEPKHWKDDDAASGPRAWLVGQAVALREMSWQLANQDTPEAGPITRWNALAWLLARATVEQTPLQAIDLLHEPADRQTFVTAQKQADLLARQAATIPWDNRRTSGTLHAIMATESEFAVSPTAGPALLFQRATRLVLALDRLSRAMDHQAPAIAPLIQDLRASPFQPAQFAADLVTFRTTIERAP